MQSENRDSITKLDLHLNIIYILMRRIIDIHFNLSNAIPLFARIIVISFFLRLIYSLIFYILIRHKKKKINKNIDSQTIYHEELISKYLPWRIIRDSSDTAIHYNINNIPMHKGGIPSSILIFNYV